MAESPIGKTLAGKFLVSRLIGQGGMGAVYEGTHIEIGKRVAIKLIDPEHARSEEIADRFRQEARAASRVDSDHIVQVFDVGNDATFGLYMVMEYLLGEDLARRLDRDGKLDLAVAVDVAYQAARGLAKAHGAGVIHRDLKPANVFLSHRDDGLITVKIVDFGISKVLASVDPESDPSGAQQGKRPITRWGSAVGTPQYMSPEQAQGHAVDHRTDVWALGCLLYEMLSGHQAYQQLDTYEQTIFAIVLKHPPPLSEIAPSVPSAIVDVVQQALEHDVEARIADCGTFAKMLEDAMRGRHATGRMGAMTSVRHDAPSRLLGAVQIGDLARSRPDAIVVPAGASGQPPGDLRGESSIAATQPLAQAISGESIARLAAAAASGIPLRQNAPTVSGVSVKAAARPSDEPAPRSRPSEDASLPPPPPQTARRANLRTIVVAFLVAIAAGIGGATYVQRHGARSGGESVDGALDRARDSASASAQATPTALTAEVAVQSESGSARPSATNGGTRPSTTKPMLPLGKLGSATSSASASGSASTRASASASASASAAPSAAGSDGQFGGAGVSESY